MKLEEFECKICQNTKGNEPYIVKEMMFGMRHEFTYIKCLKCGCLQIKQIPNNISDYYPKEQYYSFATSNLNTLQKCEMELYPHIYAISDIGLSNSINNLLITC